MNTKQITWHNGETSSQHNSLKLWEKESNEPICQFFSTMGGKYAPVLSNAPELFTLLEKSKHRLSLMPNINRDLIIEIEQLQKRILQPW